MVVGCRGGYLVQNDQIAREEEKDIAGYGPVVAKKETVLWLANKPLLPSQRRATV